MTPTSYTTTMGLGKDKAVGTKIGDAMQREAMG